MGLEYVALVTPLEPADLQPADHESSFDGDISTSNWLASDNIWIKTTAPIWWTIELRLHEKHQK